MNKLRIIGLLWLLSVPAIAQDDWFRVASEGAVAAGGGGGTAVIVQCNTNDNVTGAAISVTLTSVASGNLVVVQFAWAGTAYTPASANCSDGVASYTLNNSLVNASIIPGNVLAGSIGTWSRVTGASGSLTITVTPTGGTGSSAAVVVAYEISGLTGTFDSGASGSLPLTPTPSTSPLTGTFNTTSSGIIIATELDGAASGTVTHTAGSGFSISKAGGAHQDNNSTRAGYCSENKITGGSLTGTTAGCTLGTAEGWAILAAAFK